VSRSTLEQPVQDADTIGNINRAIAVEIETARACGAFSSKVEIIEKAGSVTDINCPVLVDVTGNLHPADADLSTYATGTAKKGQQHHKDAQRKILVGTHISIFHRYYS
jgi:hypothetical protein